MPSLRCPLISPALMVMPLPGISVPGGAKITEIPVRAFGAPHTTCTGGAPSRPVSTEHTRSRSAFGC